MGNWGGSYTRQARKDMEPRLPLPCSVCGLPVFAWQRWQVDHLRERVEGGGNEASNLWPAHGACNESKGGKHGHARRKRNVPVAPVQRRSW